MPQRTLDLQNIQNRLVNVREREIILDVSQLVLEIPEYGREVTNQRIITN